MAKQDTMTKPEPFKRDCEVEGTGDYTACCNKRDGFRCSRPRGHKGEHHAHGLYGMCLDIWDGGNR